MSLIDEYESEIGSLWQFYKDSKVACVNHAGGPTDIDPMCLYLPHRNFREWPIFDEEMFASVTENNNDDPGDGRRGAIIWSPCGHDAHEAKSIAKLLTLLGPPQMMVSINDIFRNAVDVTEPIMSLAHDFENNPESTVTEALGLVVVAGKEWRTKTVDYHYGDDGQIVWDNETDKDLLVVAGPWVTMMRELTSLPFSIEGCVDNIVKAMTLDRPEFGMQN